MGLLIDVSVDTDSIAKAAWARAVANRERLSRRLGTQAAREEAARDQGVNTINGKPIPGMGRELFNPVVTNYRPDEPVAPPNPRRSTDPSWLLVPTDSSFNAIVRNGPEFAFTQTNSIYLSQAGPLSTGALSGVPVDIQDFDYAAASLSGETPVFNWPTSGQFTFECLASLGSDNTFRPQRNVRITFDNDQIQLFFARGWTTPALITDPSLPYVTVQLSYDSTPVGSAYSGPAEEVLLVNPVNIPALLNGDFIHAAVVRRSNGEIASYINGVNVSVLESSPALPTESTARLQSQVLAEYRNIDALGIKTSPLVHGIRYTPRALYNGPNITPPATIQSLA